MFQGGPLNNTYLELFGATAQLASPIPTAGLDNARTLEFMVDVMPTKFSTTQANLAFMGTYLACGWFEMDSPTTNTTDVAPVRFGVVRNAVDKYSGDGQVRLGRRTVLYGIDNGTNIFAWQDGTALGSATSQADWTAAQKARSIDIAAPFYFGFDDTVSKYTGLRIYELWIRVSGKTVLHYRPKLDMRGGTTIRDLSTFSNNGTVSGTENTDWALRAAWDKTTAYSGKETVG